tara:strand:+ start:617 stop:829 length:213 start_codon:yes stop_codon:yes gene_type:complete
MDLRGIAQISSNEWVICGGMEADQYVSNKTYLLPYDPLVGGSNSSDSEIRIVDFTVQNASIFDYLALYDL